MEINFQITGKIIELNEGNDEEEVSVVTKELEICFNPNDNNIDNAFPKDVFAVEENYLKRREV